jgi:hypothetical protein
MTMTPSFMAIMGLRPNTNLSLSYVYMRNRVGRRNPEHRGRHFLTYVRKAGAPRHLSVDNNGF